MLALSSLPAECQVGHVHELYYNNANGIDTDLTQLTGATSVAGFAGMTALTTSPNGQFHVYYQDELDNIHQLYNNGSSWSDENLTAVARGVSARSGGSGMSGFSIGNFQYVYFVGSDLHVHEYSYVNNWVDTDLTARTNGASAGPAYQGKQIAAVLTPNNQRHVYFVANTGPVHQLYFNGTNWTDENLSASLGVYAEVNAPSVWISAVALGNFQYVYFASPDLHLHQFSYVNNWTNTDLTALTGHFTQGSVNAFANPTLSIIGIHYTDENAYLHELYYNGNWTDQNLTDDTGFAFAPINGAVAFNTSPNNQIHLYTVAASGVGQFYWNGSAWLYENIRGGTSWQPKGIANGLAGFAVGNLQHVYYVASSN
jgi:hypothetical protein